MIETDDELVPAGPTLVELGHRVEDLDEATIDGCPFGVIRVDTAGRILAYNTYEERLAGLRREDVLGKSFFFDVAPCTRVRAFYGRFLDGVARGSLHAVFGFVFPFATGARRVEITLYGRADEVWILVRG